LISALVLLIGTLVILFSMNATLTLIFLAMIPPIGVIFGFFIKTLLPRSRIVQEKLEKLNSILQENLAGIRVVKAFAREDHERSRFSSRNQDLLTENITLLSIFATFFPMIFFIANVAIVGVLWVGGLEVIAGSMTLGELVAFIGYQGFFLMPIFMLGFVGSVISRAEASAQRIFEVMDAKSEVVDKPDAIDAPSLSGHVIFDEVSFRYAGSETPVINEISFEALPNQTVAIMGRTGSGKSSIINLIPRFYDTTSGEIRIDGYDVRDLKLSSLRSQIGIVLQETTLFTGTIRDNIAYGRMDASEDDILQVAKAAQAHDFIIGFEDGYDTVVGERGVGLSGGQKQRIAIARALLLSPRILIMDDSTSSVDAETEYKIQQALEMLRQGRTTFVIAQRISTVRSADLILLLDEGRLVGKGTHAELLECCEIYTEILATQFGERAELQTAVEEALQ
jgi:ATP-binding cassette, subfamily B, multidrug efflux pump